MKKSIAILAIMMSASLGACAGSNEPDPNATTHIEWVEGAMVIKDVEPLPIANPDDPEDFGDIGAQVVDGIVTYESAGSSTCPDKVESAQLNGNVVTLQLSDYSGANCTDDLVRLRQEISMADGSDVPENASVEFGEVTE